MSDEKKLDNDFLDDLSQEDREKTPAEKEKDRRGKLALSSLHAQCEANGVAAIKFGDGEMFMFSRKTVELLKTRMDESGEDRVLIMVNSGPILREN